MTNTALTELPEQVQRENAAIARQITQFLVTDAESYTMADDWGRKIKGRIKRIDEFFEPMISAAKRAKAAAEESRKEVVLARDRAAEALEIAESHLNKQVSAYRTDRLREARMAQEASERAEWTRIAKQRAEEAQRARDAGKGQLAEMLEQAPIEVKTEPVETPDLPKTGSSLRAYWKFRILDPAAVPREWCVPDDRAIGEFVRKEKEKAVGAIPGIEVYQDDRTVW